MFSVINTFFITHVKDDFHLVMYMGIRLRNIMPKGGAAIMRNGHCLRKFTTLNLTCPTAIQGLCHACLHALVMFRFTGNEAIL